MIDLHCHLLPGIDDGPATMQASELLAKACVDNGITHALLTPHIHPGRYDNDTDSMRSVFDSFVAMLKTKKINLNVAMAAEVRICPEIVKMIPEGKIPFLGEVDGKKVILLEFPHSHLLHGSEKMVQWLLDRDIVPMIAHPERNRDICDSVDKLAAYIEMGCMVQITAGSVTGRFGTKVKSAADEMLRRGWVNILATDAHNLKGRPPELREGVLAAAEVIGMNAANRLVHSAALEIAGTKFMRAD